MSTTAALVLHQHGEVADSLVFEPHWQLPELGPESVRLRVAMAVVNPADHNVIQGNYGRLPPLPAIIGNEAYAEVIEVGSQVTQLRLGDWCRPRDGVGCWCKEVVCEAAAVQVLPSGLSPEQGAQIGINPATAWGILHEAKHLQAGHWVCVNGATSAVGLAFLALARNRGLKVACLTRRVETIPELKARGADLVLEDKRGVSKELRASCGADLQLALNMVGGESAANQIKALGPMGHHVTIGAMARQPLSLPNGPMIFNELVASGFWVSRWMERQTESLLSGMYDEIADLMKNGDLELPVAHIYSLAEGLAAVTGSSASGRGGKILIKP